MQMPLPDAALKLLPESHESIRCADFSRRVGVAPRGTAIHADVVVLIETPRPWPKPVFAHPLLEGLAGTMELRCGRARVLAAEVDGDRSTRRVTIYERHEVGIIGTAFEVADASELASLMAQLADAAPQEIADPVPQLDVPDLAVLVCTQGSHDICCGSDGVRFANELEAAAPGLTVFRVSHTGGHRFAPTAMTLPDGRMWANLDVDATLSILDLTGDAATLARKCRGWWGAATGPAQVAETALLERLGWELDLLPRSVAVNGDPNGDEWEVRLDVARDLWVARVAAGRIVPTIACRAEGGLPAKPGQEYEVVSLEPAD